jgi:HAD superfamily hydrolase (TIGR01662 family)
MVIIFDLDQTLIDTSSVELLRKKRDWQSIYPKIPDLIPYSGINELLDYLSGKEIKTALVTKSPRPYCSRIIESNNWNFDAIVCYHDCSHQKPHPEPILKAIQMLNANPEEVFSVGDDGNDIIASKGAGAKTIGVSWGIENSEALNSTEPDHIFETVEELNDFFKEQL